MAPPKSSAAWKICRVSALRFSTSGWKTPRCTLPSPTWPHPLTNVSCGRRQLGHLGQVLGDGRPGDDRVDDVVGAGGLGHEEEAFPCLDEVGARLRREDVHVDGTEVAEQRARAARRPRPSGTPSSAPARRRGRPSAASWTDDGDAEVEAGRAGDAAQHERVGVLEDRRVDAARHDPGHRVRHLVERRERGQHRRRSPSGRGCTFTITSVVTASVPSEPMSSCVRS